MNPHQKNKVDLSSLSSEEQRLFRLYGKLPNKKDLLQNKLKERKYFDSGDYALSKAGKASDTGVTTIGTEHPRADGIPHSMHPLTNTISRTDSISGASPPPLTNPALAVAGQGEGAQPTVQGGPSPAGMHRGSINGIPGGNLSSVANMSRSPIKEQSHLAKSASADRMEEDVQQAVSNVNDGVSDEESSPEAVSPPSKTEGIPIRR